jgi:hypothetical protein
MTDYRGREPYTEQPDPADAALERITTAEGCGILLLVAAVIGAAIMAAVTGGLVHW